MYLDIPTNTIVCFSGLRKPFWKEFQMFFVEILVSLTFFEEKSNFDQNWDVNFQNIQVV